MVISNTHWYSLNYLINTITDANTSAVISTRFCGHPEHTLSSNHRLSLSRLSSAALWCGYPNSLSVVIPNTLMQSVIFSLFFSLYGSRCGHPEHTCIKLKIRSTSSVESRGSTHLTKDLVRLHSHYMWFSQGVWKGSKYFSLLII